MMERILKIIKIIRFVYDHSDCSVPYIRDQLGISHSDPPLKEEKGLYKIITLLSNQGYIRKNYYKNRIIGGARFSLALTDSGNAFIKELGLDGNSNEQNLEQIKASINLKIQGILKGKVSRPLQVELSRELSDAIIEEISSN
jgi:hypothetical protein